MKPVRRPTPPLNPHRDGWPLDYGWARRGGAWTPEVDVLLIADPRGDDCAGAALREWAGLQEHEPGDVDGRSREVFYVGGVRGYLDAAPKADPDDESGTERGAESGALYLHSHGEDAFDSLHHHSKQIGAFLRSRGCSMRLRWIEARHDRADHRLLWP